MSLKNRFRIVVGVAMLGLLVLAGVWLTTERSRILREKQEKVKDLVETARSILAECYQMQQHGASQAEAQKQAIVLLKNLRYEGDNYFWVNDFHPTMVMHPTKPQLDGTDLTGFKDPTGKALFVEMAETVRANGAGFVAYEWPRPGTTKPVPKISYVEGFAPWGWIVGTGIYIDDVDAIWRQSALEAAAIMAVLLVLMAASSISAYSRMFGPLQRMVACMKDVAEGEGDLTKRLEVPPDQEVAELAGWFNTFMVKVQTALAAVAGSVQTLAAAGKQIAVTSRQQKKSAEEQQDQVCQVATAMKEMAATVQQISQSSNNAAAASQKAADTARRGGEVVEETLSRMSTIADSVGQTAEKVQGLGKRSDEIGRIIRVIDDIADQTNLLALNAAIEAARAGDQGRGFAVVADEVRKLAERTSGATKEIAEMITKIQAETQDAVTAMQAGTKEVELGVASTQQAGCSLREIIQTSEGVGDMITQIAAAATEQSAATEEINDSVEQISKITESTSAGTQQASKAIEDLSLLASNLQQLVSQFRLQSEGDLIGRGSGSAAPRHKAAAAASSQ